MEIKEATFDQILEGSKTKEGIVLLGVGGDLQDWVTGVSDSLFNEEIASTDEPQRLWREAIKLTTTGGRTDLLLTFNSAKSQINIAALAMWRLRFGDCSWLSDYVVNYRDHHVTI